MPPPAQASSGQVVWPLWARILASVVLAVHLGAMLAIALAGRPASVLEGEVASLFATYAEAIHQSNAHRYYAPAPPPTPIVLAEIRADDGTILKTRRIPNRSTQPRIRYQRELALAYHLYNNAMAVRNGAAAIPLAPAYARHLISTTPGATSVTLRVQQHLVPDLVRLRDEGPIDPDDSRFFTVPERIGDFPEADTARVENLASHADNPQAAPPLPPTRPSSRSPFARPEQH